MVDSQRRARLSRALALVLAVCLALAGVTAPASAQESGDEGYGVPTITGPVTEPGAEGDPETGSEGDLDPEPELDPDPDPEPEADPQSEADPQASTEHGTEGNSGTESADTADSVPVVAAQGDGERASAPSDGADKDEADRADAVAAEADGTSAPSVSYRTHVQTYGWTAWSSDGAPSGTTGEAKRLEGVRIRLVGPDGKELAGVRYKAHVQGIGWTGWVADGELAGTTGQSRRVEALKVRLEGEAAARWEVCYRVHSQTYGWMGWTSGGRPAGTTGQSKRLEALEVRLVPKGSSQVPSGEGAYSDGAAVSLSGHVQSIGWQPARAGEAGTTGRSLRMEAVRASLNAAPDCSGSVVYSAHVQGIGWMGEVADGGLAGTTGQSRRVEAFRFRLEGEVASLYDVWYRAHVQSIGWLGWASNGDPAGTAGLSRRMEALQVRLVPKGQGAPPASGQALRAAFVSPPAASYDSSVDGLSWQGARSGGVTSGAEGGAALDAVRARLSSPAGGLAGSISYQVRAKGTDAWSDASAFDEPAGTAGTDIDALRFTLSGDVANVFNVWYRVHVTNTGWMGWAANGQDAGTANMNLAVDAYQLQILPRFSSAPSNAGAVTSNPMYYDKNAATIDTYLNWAVDIANDDSHGYSQYNRWGPDYDCSALVISALRKAGLPTGSASYTGDMLENLRNLGWMVMTFSSRNALLRGDILLTPFDHTEFFLGNNKNVRAWMSENRSIGGAQGDQTGWEIQVVDYNDNGGKGWDYVLRLK